MLPPEERPDSVISAESILYFDNGVPNTNEKHKSIQNTFRQCMSKELINHKEISPLDPCVSFM